MKRIFTYLLLAVLGSITGAFSANLDEKSQYLFLSPGTDGHPYRIPAITTLKNGNILAVADFRWCDSDIGYGHIDLVGRISRDNGTSWEKEFNIAVGSGQSGAHDCGYGDAAIVTDRESGKVLILCCTGNVVYSRSSRSNPMRSARIYSDNNGETWSTPEDITDQMYALLPNTKALFVGSGKICQSRVTKVGKYYRLYAALCTLNQSNVFSTHSENFVIYSDDFGKTWNVLGSDTESCAPNGDEPKCEELPDGSVVLSSRKDKGRYFNIFKYTNVKAGQGNWTGVVSSNDTENGLAFNTNSTNGEIQLLQVVRNSDRTLHYMMLQSVPYGKLHDGDDDRSNVCIFYKVFDTPTLGSATELATGWTRGITFEDPQGAYSTLCVQTDNRIGFLYETSPGEFSIVYRPITVEELTGNGYSLYDPDIHGNLDMEEQKMEEAKTEARAVLEEFAGRHAENPALGQVPTSAYNNLQEAYDNTNKANYPALLEAVEQLKAACNWPIFTINSMDPNEGTGKSLNDNGSGALGIATTDNSNQLMQWKFEGLDAQTMKVGEYTVTNVSTGGRFWNADFVAIGNTSPNTDGQFVIRTNGTDDPVVHEVSGVWFWKEDKITKSNLYDANSGAAWSFTFVGGSYELGRPGIVADFNTALAEARKYEGRTGTAPGTYRDPDGRLMQALDEAEQAEAEGLDQVETFRLENLTAALNSALAEVQLNMPEAGGFYRFRSKNTGKYITANGTEGERLTMTDRADDPATVFFLSANGELTDCTPLNLYSSWTADPYGSYSRYSFTEAGAMGYYLIQPDDLSYLYDNSAKNGTLDNWSEADNEGCFWEIIEVDDPQAQPALTRSITTEYATVAAPVALNIPDGIRAYSVTVDESREKALLTELTDGVIPAGTGVVVQRTTDESNFRFTFAPEGYLYDDNDLQPVYQQKEIGTDVNACILAVKNGVTGFYRLNDSDRTLRGYKAYLVLPQTLQAIQALTLDDSAITGIGTVKQPEKTAGTEEYYDLQGRRVKNLRPGIYIRNHQKIMIH